MSEPQPPTTEELSRLHPADIADQLQRLPTNQAIDQLTLLPENTAAAALVEMEAETAHEMALQLPLGHLRDLLTLAPTEAAADIVGDLEDDRRAEVLKALPPETCQAVKSLLRYPEDTAGGIMNDRFISLHSGLTIGEALENVRSLPTTELTDVNYLYVTDQDKKLLGVLPLRELVFNAPDRRVDDLLQRDVRYLHVDDDQEHIAREFAQYHYLGLPVLDSQSRLVGIVPASEALEIAQEEATEDMQLMVGLSGEEHTLTPWWKSIGRRLPWLFVNLLTAFAAAAVVSLFESTIAQWTALAVFLPIIAGQGGNAGMQTLTVVIRDLALGQLSPGDGRKALTKESILALVNGLAVGSVVGLAGYLWKNDATLGLVAGGAMILNQFAAAVSGVLIPLGLRLAKVDPALASSIFLTTITDVAGFFFFLGLAYLALNAL
jgi:magnesium transporter